MKPNPNSPDEAWIKLLYVIITGMVIILALAILFKYW